jgi:alkyl hydroperoxide reductase subunit F
MAILNPRIKTTVIDGGLFQDESRRARSWACPACSGRPDVPQRPHHAGRNPAKVDTGAAKRDAEKLSARAPLRC